MRLQAALLVIVAVVAGSAVRSQQGAPATAGMAIGATAKPAEPFKVGTFEIRGMPKVALVLRDSLIVDIEAANRALQINPAYVHMTAPRDMLELIGQYDYGLRYRLYEIVNDLVAHRRLEGNRPEYVYDLKSVRTLAPILYPGKLLNAAVNFYSHVNEAGTPEEQAAARRQRREQRGVPYLFLKPGRGAIIGNGENVVLPWGRDRMDWEVELSAVIGRTARYVDANNAQDHVFGYTVFVDISDRGGRPPGGYSSGSDWFVGKGHDTSAPMGPWIVPKEFYGDPMKNLRQTLSVGGTQLQEARAGDMIHSLWELIEYASSIATLFPGDIINNGTSGGTAAGSEKTRTGDRFLKGGEVVEASIDGIGTLRMPVVAGAQPPGGTGSRLPPVSSYRKPQPTPPAKPEP
jgi:2-keto-4-pentenoate hydratase/2-oxohepta-3-ene-1,7-dioic acid hydratase in catechol pathway